MMSYAQAALLSYPQAAGPLLESISVLRDPSASEKRDLTCRQPTGGVISRGLWERRPGRHGSRLPFPHTKIITGNLGRSSSKIKGLCMTKEVVPPVLPGDDEDERIPCLSDDGVEYNPRGNIDE